MTDDPTDRRIRQLLGEMVADAPEASALAPESTEIGSVGGTERRPHRLWLAAAAAALLVVGLVGAVVARGTDDSLSVTSQDSDGEPTPEVAPSPTVGATTPSPVVDPVPSTNAPAVDGVAVIVDAWGEALYRFGAPAPDVEPWIVDQITAELLRDENLSILGRDEAARTRALEEEGFVIRVALRPALDERARAAFAELDERLDVAAITVDNRTGEIIGAASRSGESLGRAQPAGSARLAIYAAALESGMSVDDIVDGTGPCEVEFPGGSVTLDNFGGSEGGSAQLVDQAVRASRCAEARLEAFLDGAAIELLASTTGADVAGLVIDLPALTAAEHTGTVVASANGGVLPRIGFVSEVLTADGRSIHRRDSTSRVMSAPVASGLTEVLRAIVERGTGTRAQVEGMEVAGLTGTDPEFRAAWFVGTADGLTTAVWIALPDGEPMLAIGGRNVTGGSYPAETWARIRRPVPDDGSELCPSGFPVGQDTTGDGIVDTCYQNGQPPSTPVEAEQQTDTDISDLCPADFPVGRDTTGDGVIDICYAE